MKRLVKSQDRKIFGVCGGVAEYFGIDPTVIRVVWAILALSGVGILAYLAAAIIIPDA